MILSKRLQTSFFTLYFIYIKLKERGLHRISDFEPIGAKPGEMYQDPSSCLVDNFWISKDIDFPHLI